YNEVPVSVAHPGLEYVPYRIWYTGHTNGEAPLRYVELVYEPPQGGPHLPVEQRRPLRQHEASDEERALSAEPGERIARLEIQHRLRPQHGLRAEHRDVHPEVWCAGRLPCSQAVPLGRP